VREYGGRNERNSRFGSAVLCRFAGLAVPLPAEPIAVYPLLRLFAIGLCIMFFPTFVLGTINSVMSPVVKGCNQMLETQTFDMNKYREQKDKLEYEAMMRNPETAYLVNHEEFDKRLDELGWSPSDLVTMAGMWVERGMYDIKKAIRLPVATCFGFVFNHSR
jgi:conjugative transposon TraJ protein